MKNIFSKLLHSFRKSQFCTKSRLSQIMSQLRVETPEDKDLRYEDELFYFEKEWKILQADKIRLHQDYPTTDLTDHQQQEVDILFDRVNKLNSIERQYFNYVIEEYSKKNPSVELERMNVFVKGTMTPFVVNIPEHNPNTQITEEIVADLAPFIAAGYFSGSAAAAEAKVEVKEEKKEEKPKEVMSYYLEINI